MGTTATRRLHLFLELKLVGMALAFIGFNGEAILKSSEKKGPRRRNQTTVEGFPFSFFFFWYYRLQCSTYVRKLHCLSGLPSLVCTDILWRTLRTTTTLDCFLIFLFYIRSVSIQSRLSPINCIGLRNGLGGRGFPGGTAKLRSVTMDARPGSERNDGSAPKYFNLTPMCQREEKASSLTRFIFLFACLPFGSLFLVDSAIKVGGVNAESKQKPSQKRRLNTDIIRLHALCFCAPWSEYTLYHWPIEALFCDR